MPSWMHERLIGLARAFARSMGIARRRVVQLVERPRPGVVSRRSEVAGAAAALVALAVLAWSFASRPEVDRALDAIDPGAALESSRAARPHATRSSTSDGRIDSARLRRYAVGPVGFQDVPVSGLAALAPLVRYDGYDADPIALPSVGAKNMPLGLEDLDVDAKKRVFVRTVVPLIVAENERIAADRTRLLAILDGAAASTPADDADWLLMLMAAYRLRDRGPGDGDFLRNSLLRRVDQIPVALALAQAAIESAWGTSRFTLEGNALFGEWTFDPKTPGLVPAGREAGATYRVRAFPTLRESVRHYMRNLNCGSAYAEFRTRRWQARQAGREADAGMLARTLTRYSARGSDYVDELRMIMTTNRFDRFEDASLDPLDLDLVAELVALASMDAGTAESLLAFLAE